MRDSSPETNTGPYLVCEKFEFGIFHCPCSSLGVSDGRAISDEYRTQTVRFRSYLLPVLLTLLNWSTAVRRSGGEIVMRPFDVRHANSDLKKAGLYAQGVGVNTRIVMEHTSIYWKPIALTLKKAGFFVFVVNAMLIHDFRDNTNIEEIRRLMAQSTTGGQFIRFRKFT